MWFSLRHALTLLAAVILLAVPAATAGGAQNAPPGFLLIGDSVSTGMLWHRQAVAVLQKNLAVDWQVAVCRTLTGVSCPFDGERAETALELIVAMPSVPPIVVVEMGYNDPAGTFATAVDQTVSKLVAKGAKHVLWLTLRASRAPYPQLDTVLTRAVARYPQLELVDWNTYSASQIPWFQNDFVHLTAAGGVAMAHLVHASVVALIAPLHVQPTALPALRPGRMYRTHLRAIGGTGPYRWSVGSGRPPRGIHLLADGVLYGRPVGSAAMDFLARITDADGVKAWTTVYAPNASS